MSETVTEAQTLREHVAEEVRALLGRRRMSSVALARTIGKSHTYVWRRLNGETAFDLDDLQGIAVALGVSVRSLIPGAMGDIKPSHTPHPLASVRILRNTAPNDRRPSGRSHASTRPNGQRRTSRVA